LIYFTLYCFSSRTRKQIFEGFSPKTKNSTSKFGDQKTAAFVSCHVTELW